jgi:hypothetical protein
MATKSKAIPIISVGCLGLAFILFGLFNYVFQKWENNVEIGLATLIATDNSIVAPGDAAHSIPITPESALNIGNSANIFGIKIKLTNAGYLKNADNMEGEREHWFVDFTIENIESEIPKSINPVVESQIQYLLDDVYVWEVSKVEYCVPDLRSLSAGLAPGESIQCRFSYLVPSDERNLYWMYAMDGIGTNGSWEERFAVFNIR